MYSFKNDYSEGAHPNILDKLIETNLIQQSGYGEDDYSNQAKELIKQKINNPNAKIYLVSGGTQSNLLVISSLLKPHEAVISADSGHIASNEAGAIESIGHKIITIPSKNGKIKPLDIELVLKEYSLRPHVVKPKMVYISNSTEMGTIYQKNELKKLYELAQSKNLFLFLDGARLGHALMSENNDLSLKDISQMTDVFYIGGTKNGALLGEAIVFNQQCIAPEFDYILKQKGALLAKGRLLGIQFLELFKDDLFFELAEKANKMAIKIANVIEEKGYSFLSKTDTNQIFPIVPNSIKEKLKEKYSFYEWKTIDENTTALRLITSWTTDEEKVNEFIEYFKTNC